MGVRFLDLRVAPNGILVHNVVSCNTSLLETIHVLEEFLRIHPREFIIARIKEEGPKAIFKGVVVDNLMKQILHEYGSFIKYIRNDEDLPTLKDLRGKVTVLCQWKTN